MPIPLHLSYFYLYFCLALPRIYETVPMPDFHYKAEATSKLDVVKSSSCSSDAKNHSRLQCLKSHPREGITRHNAFATCGQRAAQPVSWSDVFIPIASTLMIIFQYQVVIS